MKSVLLNLSLLVLFFTVGNAYGDSKNIKWIFGKKYDDVSVYSSKPMSSKEEPTRLTLKYKKASAKKSFIDPKKITKKFIKNLNKTKIKMLDFIGVTHWKLKDIKIKHKKGNVAHVTLSGSYNDSKNRTVYFTEYHFYSSSKNLQLLLTNNTKKLLTRDATLNTIKRFKSKYDF